MHAQGLSSVNHLPPKKKKRKMTKSNSRKFYIYNLTWKGLKKPPSFHAQRTSHNKHTSGPSPSADAAHGVDRKMRRQTDRHYRGLGNSSGPNREEAQTMGNRCLI